MLLPLLALSGCAPQAESTVATLNGDYYAVVAGDSSSAMNESLAGRLVLDDAGCYSIENDGGVHSILWPRGTFIDQTGLNVPGYDGPREGGIGEGTPITMHGGEIAAAGDEVPCWNDGRLVWVATDVGYGFGV